MAILTRVAPWLAYLLGAALFGERWSAPFAAAATLAIVVAELARGARPAELILDGSSLVYFTAFSVLALTLPGSALLAYVAAGAQLFHAAVITAFLAAGLPFTLPLARRSVPAEVGRSEAFLRFNRLLTLVWLASFAVSGAVMVALLAAGVRMTWLQIVIVVVSIIVPTVVQRRMIEGARGTATSRAPRG